MFRLLDPLSVLGSLNAAQVRAVRAFGAKTVEDLVRIYPRRYDDYSNTVSIRQAPVGEGVTLRVKIQKIQKQPGFRKRISIIRAVVEDVDGSGGTGDRDRRAVGTLRVIWFNQPWLLDELKPGREIFLSGVISQHPKFGKQMGNPLWEDPETAIAGGRIAPVYPLTGNIAQKTMRELMAQVVDGLGEVEDPLPNGTFPLSLKEAIRLVHRPATPEEAEQGRERLAFEEFVIYRLAIGSVRQEVDEAGAPVVEFDEAFAKKFVAALPFPLTPHQKRAAWDALQNMGQRRPMRRLLQGDVGSGKTVVAAMLLAMAYRSNQSGVLLAPTELLAQQHAATVRRFLEIGSAPVLLLTSAKKILWEGGEETVMKLSEARDRIASGRIIVVGTHALLERGMLPPDTALSIADEQHRFGVSQRETLAVGTRPDGKVPHLLSMTATPIPRSLALTLYGDLEISSIRVKPAGRKPIATRVLMGEDREKAYAVVRKEVAAGRRAYVVCPLIDTSDTLGVSSVTDESKRLASGPLKGLRIGMLHGKLSNADKEGVMKTFAEGLLDVLVATTVVEVGVDVPEATVMLIEGADRFGLAQLHQLRGRVGRSDHASSCFLLTDTDDPLAQSRLAVLTKTNDGFVIAEEDLKRRGTGNLTGTQQSGRTLFRAARFTDIALMTQARDAAAKMLERDPHLASMPVLAAKVEEMRKSDHGE
ncbi:MAG: ATP-dependent helicase RecG [Candidatus Parcubacteria bacterium]|jgi:ATP-dependent DNA helicase RecG